MREFEPRFRKAGAEIALVLCQKRSAVRSWLGSRPVPFPVIADEDRSNAKRWGAYVRLNYDSINIARPASFVVGRNGVVKWSHVSKHQMDPADLDAALASVLAD